MEIICKICHPRHLTLSSMQGGIVPWYMRGTRQVGWSNSALVNYHKSGPIKSVIIQLRQTEGCFSAKIFHHNQRSFSFFLQLYDSTGIFYTRIKSTCTCIKLCQMALFCSIFINFPSLSLNFLWIVNKIKFKYIHIIRYSLFIFCTCIIFSLKKKRNNNSKILQECLQ